MERKRVRVKKKGIFLILILLVIVVIGIILYINIHGLKSNLKIKLSGKDNISIEVDKIAVVNSVNIVGVIDNE